ncbi:hypothetical protein CspeluHIS016_0702990 [Cutaneotrichosporon spelunceum]|uniref:CAP-Gly domain-containing protein n=1 Tax=Cutaneotrichosporon spelunceum TaxID=1672016 RepID=A0AAD3TZA2_9TREE|nr:hypothetical protein CspeluHIS016_0702990 [Cutaneotrichosporon spelunceum]
MSEYTVGKRYLHARTRAPLTLRYVGLLPGLDATWLGVEYDDPTRGKHGGDHKGEQIFHAAPNAGAFIKCTSTRPLVEGAELIAALQERYGLLEGEDGGRQGADSVLLGDSGIVVEAPGMEDVARRIERLERLREVGLESEWVAQLGGSERERKLLKERLKAVRILDLSSNLLSSWRDVGEIVAHLTGLKVLILNHSRIQSVRGTLSNEEMDSLRNAFATVSELHLGYSALNWAEAVDIASLFPALQTLFLNHNSGIVDLSTLQDQDAATSMSRLQVLSIDGCRAESWSDVAHSLSALPALTAAQLSELPITTISPRRSSLTFPHLTRLTLGGAHVFTWADIDRLDDWTAGRLENLRISCASRESGVLKRTTDPLLMSGNPSADRPLLIAKLARLTSLNGSNVTPAERWDSELFYVHYVDKLPVTERSTWARYAELVKKHDIGPKAPGPMIASNHLNLKSKLIVLNVIPPNGMTMTLRLLPSATTASLQKRVARQLKVPAVRVWTARPHPEAPEAIGAWEPVAEMDQGQEIGYWVGDGDTVVVVV